MQITLSVVVALSTLTLSLLGRRLASLEVGVSAALLFALVASVPNFTGDQLNAEIAGALPVLAAMLLLLRRTPIGAWHALAAGALLGTALLFKATFAADVLAALAVPSLLALARRRRPSWPELATTLLLVAGVLLLCGAAALALWARGEFSGLLDVLLHQDPRYAAWGQLAGPTATPPPTYCAQPPALL